MNEQTTDNQQAVRDLVEATQALSQGNFEQELGQYFQGELGLLAQHIEGLRKSLKSLSPQMASSAHLVPEAGRGVSEISQQAETSVNSILELVDEMCTDQDRVVDILAQGEADRSAPLDISALREISEKSRSRLMKLMSYLSFQDVVRQRAEKVQVMIDEVEGKIGEMLSKFGVSAEPVSIAQEEQDAAQADAAQDVDQALIDDYFK